MPKLAARLADRFIYKVVVENDNHYTKNIRYERYKILSNLLGIVKKSLNKKNISSPVRKILFKVFIGNIMLENKKIEHVEFIKEFAQEPPGFITISPGNKCNLQCTGCYVASGAKASEKLDYDIANRIVHEKTELRNSFFKIISGGEPLMWKS